LNHPPQNALVAPNQAIDGGVFEEFEAGLNQAILDKAIDSNRPIKDAKNELKEMQKSQNSKDDIFFKNYLLKHLELIKLYEDGKEVRVEKFEKAGDNLDSVYQKFNQLRNEARNECLDFLLANASNLQQLTLPNIFERKGSQNQDNNFELAEEIYKLRSLIPPIFNPLKPQGQTPDERVIYRFLLNQQRILLSQNPGSEYGKEPQPFPYRPTSPTNEAKSSNKIS
jgi:hypothetical protein